LYSVAKPPEDLSRINKAFGKAAKHRSLKGVGFPPNISLRNVVRKAPRRELSVGRSDDGVRLFLNLGILICVKNYADDGDVTLFDAELMQRLANEERIPSTPTEDQLTERATELIRSVEEQEAPRSSDVRVIHRIDIEEVVLALIEASEDKTLGDLGTVSGVVRNPLKALVDHFPPDIRREELSSWIELAKFEGYLEEIGDGWRLQLDRKTPTPSTAPSIDDAIIQLRSLREEAKAQLVQAKERRQKEREALEQEVRGEISRFEEGQREQVSASLRSAEERARSDKEAREAERVAEAERGFKEIIAIISEEEKERLESDIRDAQTDFDARMQQAEVATENFRAAKYSERDARDKQRDGDAFSQPRAEIERKDAEIQSLTRVRDQTSQ
jgi:hypothetical protein